MVLTSLILVGGYNFAHERYGYDGYGDGYRFDSNRYYEDEYWLDNASYYLDRHRDPAYYYYHPRADVYFVSLGNITFVIPAYEFRPYLHRRNFVMVPRNRFISLSCGRLDYYDNYLRFNFYFDFFNHYRWNRKHHRRLRTDYRNYYSHRHQNSWYKKNRRIVMKERLARPHNSRPYGSYSSSHSRNRYKSYGSKKYNYGKSSHSYKNKYKYSKSSSSRKTYYKKSNRRKYGRDRN